MQENWYIKENLESNAYGPYSMEEIQQFLQLGKIHIDFFLFQDNKNWKTIEEYYRSKGSASKIQTKIMPFQQPTGVKFGSYELLSILGKGGMGVVYKAKDIKLNRLVALKCIKEESANEEWKKRFLREAQLNASLDHPNIVRVFESADQPVPYIAMEYLEGRPLNVLIQEGLLSIPQKVDIFHKICQAIEYAHRQKIIHRDIKPANIMVLNNGNVKVMDFGLAKNLDVSQSFSHVGQIMGTPKYMSPEQAKGKKVDKRTDIYALGAVFYEMLTGRAPYDGNSVFQILLQIAEKEPIVPKELNPQIPQDLQTICLKCLDKKAQRRYYSTRHLCKDIELYQDNRPIHAREPNFIEKSIKWIQRNPVVSVLILSMGFTLMLACFALSEYFERNKLLQENQKQLLSKYYKEGCDYFHQKEFEKACESFKQAINNKKDDFQSHWMLGCIYLIQGEFFQAHKNLNNAIQNIPVGKAQLFLLKSLCYAEEEDYFMAKEFWEKAKLLYPKSTLSLEEYLPELGKKNMQERINFQMPLPGEILCDTKARYYTLIELLPQEESQLAKKFLQKKTKQDNNLELYKIGYTLYQTNFGWPKELKKEVSFLSLKEMLLYVHNQWILDMASPHWTRLKSDTQAKYASLYQKAYARQTKQPVQKIFEEQSKGTKQFVSFPMVLIPPGQFLLGKPFESEGDGPQQQVIISYSYYMSQIETTQSQWLAVAKMKNPKELPWKGHEYIISHPKAPATNISYTRIKKEFLNQLSGYYFPDEIEWEYACRAGTTSLGFWGEKDPKDYVWYVENAVPKNAQGKEDFKNSKIKKVAQKKPNPWGLYDMSGNIVELCKNTFFHYSLLEAKNRSKEKFPLPEENDNVVYRGGSIGSFLKNCFSTKRETCYIKSFNSILGFRIIKK